MKWLYLPAFAPRLDSHPAQLVIIKTLNKEQGKLLKVKDSEACGKTNIKSQICNPLVRGLTSVLAPRLDDFGPAFTCILHSLGHTFPGHQVGVVGGTHCDLVLDCRQQCQVWGPRAGDKDGPRERNTRQRGITFQRHAVRQQRLIQLNRDYLDTYWWMHSKLPWGLSLPTLDR